jgi:uncharacterized membrane protein YccC
VPRVPALLGTLIGIAFSFLNPLWLGYIVALIVALVICGLFGLRNSSRLAGVTVTIVMLVRSGAYMGLAIDRVSEVVLGLVVALAVTTFVFPDRARLRLHDGLAHRAARALLSNRTGAPRAKGGFMEWD